MHTIEKFIIHVEAAISYPMAHERVNSAGTLKDMEKIK